MANAHITGFIQSLNEEETKSARNYIYQILSACKVNSYESKQLILFDYITSNKEKKITESKISKITGTKHISSLKVRLYETIIEALTLNKYIDNNNDLGEAYQTFFKLKKKILFLRFIIRTENQKRVDTIQHLLNEIIKESREYEMYDLAMEALVQKKQRIGIRSDLKEFDKINDEITFYEYCSKATRYASDCYFRLIINDNLAKSFSHKELDTFFQESIQQMQIDYQKTKSQSVAYYLHIICFALCERQKKYSEAIKFCNKLISIITKSKVIYQKERIGYALNNLCLFKNHMGDYKGAVMAAQKAQTYINRNTFNYTISKEQEFCAHFYGNNLKPALKCANALLKHYSADLGKFRRAKYVYYQCCTLFALKKYNSIPDILKIPLEIEKDERWNISLRIFKIMLFIELHRIDEAARGLESLRKYIERSKSKEISPRDLLIVKTLRELEKENFEFRPTNTTVVKMLNKLSAKNSPISWEHYTQELIQFHKWLEGKKL